MKWLNARTDKLPEHNQQVLVSVDGVYYMATFDAGNKCFILITEPPRTLVYSDKHSIYWTAVTDP